MARKPKQTECIYCGRIGRMGNSRESGPSFTEEHVIPRALFPGRKLQPGQTWVKGWACKECNEAKAKLDTYMRDLLVNDGLSFGVRARDLVRENFVRAFTRGQSEFAKESFKHAVPVQLFSKSGIFLGNTAQVPFNSQKLEAYFLYIVKGLHLHLADSRLPKGTTVSILKIQSSDEFNDIVQPMFNVQAPVTLKLGMEEFACAFWPVKDAEEEGITAWFLVFYERISFVVFTHPTGYRPTT